ncbi:MAG TPA: hypothetical protein VMU41_17280 [Candidatus Binataceae bacterium]|nr:hypothetical protein [Candidatus Binataceae bacterium]
MVGVETAVTNTLSSPSLWGVNTPSKLMAMCSLMSFGPMIPPALFFSTAMEDYGGYETKFISFAGDRVTATDPTQQVAQDFVAYREKLGIRCDEDPNLYPIGFLDRSHAFIAAETVHHSVCACYGSIRAYEIDLPSGKIVQAYNQAAAKKMFGGNLPWDLSKAPNDNWDTDPKSCS